MHQHETPKIAYRGVIFGMYVVPDAQGGGAVASLMECAIEHSIKVGIWQLELTVNEANSRANAFYVRQGFSQYGRVPNAVIGENGPEHDLKLLRILPHPS